MISNFEVANLISIRNYISGLIEMTIVPKEKVRQLIKLQQDIDLKITDILLSTDYLKVFEDDDL
jgi:methionine salvage enolase-phosphatase E1